MRHRKSGRKLGVGSAHRRALLRNLVTSLMLHGRIRTTEARAKELRRVADRVITMGKTVPVSVMEGLEGEALVKARATRLHALRRARVWLKDRAALNRVFGEYSERYQQRAGGYTRILKIGARPGDTAAMVIIEMVEESGPVDAAEISDAGGDDAGQSASV